jgi:hypothetical protein
LCNGKGYNATFLLLVKLSVLLLVFIYVQILFNKAVLYSMKFPFPMFLTTWHMLFATVLTQVLSKTTDMLPGVKEVSAVVV